MRIKICGITKLEDALLCSELGADAIGFIFYENSKRFIHKDEAKLIVDSLPSFIHKVGVFVNEEPFFMNKLSKEIGLTLVQLHGDESQEVIDQIDLPVIKAIRIKEKSDFEIIENYRNCKILLDAYSAIDYGGTGTKFSWNEIPSEVKSKIILSGGIKIDDLENIFNDIKPEAIDLSSGVELKPGIKDHQKLNELFSLYNKLRGN